MGKRDDKLERVAKTLRDFYGLERRNSDEVYWIMLVFGCKTRKSAEHLIAQAKGWAGVTSFNPDDMKGADSGCVKRDV